MARSQHQSAQRILLAPARLARPGLSLPARMIKVQIGTVSRALPFVTIIIPTGPGQEEIGAIAALRSLDYPRDCFEVIVARGRQPAVQRNAALQAARGELIYFLDDDSRAPPDNLRRALVHFEDPQVKMLGGPNLCPADAPLLEQI